MVIGFKNILQSALSLMKENSPEKVAFAIGSNRRGTGTISVASGSTAPSESVEKKEEKKSDAVNDEEEKDSSRWKKKKKKTRFCLFLSQRKK